MVHPAGVGALSATRAAGSTARIGGMLGGHYLVRQAIRHSAKGGIYLAVDRNSDAQVVIKHARAYAESDPHGADARDRLRHEAEMLQRLAGCAAVPRFVELFEQDGDVFLAAERIEGRALRAWVADNTSTGSGVPAAQAIPMAYRLIELIKKVHAAGIVIGDLSPTNIIVGPDDSVSLVDLELATAIGERATRGGTPGYRDARRTGGHAAADPSDDAFSLGALLFLLATGNDPVLPDDGRAVQRRLAAWLGHAAADHPLRPAIVRLTAPAPEDRGPLTLDGPHPVPRPELPRTSRLFEDGLAYLCDTITPERERLWSTGEFGGLTDPGNVQHGAAGVLSVLLREDRGDVARTAANWLAKQQRPAGRVLPGLYFGRAGVAWALAEAGIALQDDGLSESAVAIARELPLQWGNPDVAHGLAGAGMAQLRVGQLTGNSELRNRAAEYAKAVAAAARIGEQGPLWTVPVSFPSRFAGGVFYGFAHGTAGIGYFLLVAGIALDKSEYVDLAVQAGDGLLALAEEDERSALWWANGPADPTRLPHWCNGSSGVGTFLLRLFAVTGDDRYARAAAGAGRAVHESRWQSLPSACHGLAGNGQFLLDAAGLLGDQPYRQWAADLATFLAIRTARVDGRLLVADETGRSVVADYNVGLAGVLDFLHRLESGGPRPWMLDDLLVESTDRC